MDLASLKVGSQPAKVSVSSNFEIEAFHFKQHVALNLKLFGDLVLPEDVWVVELVHELHLLEHVGPVGAVLVHLQHHHLPRRLVGHLQKI